MLKFGERELDGHDFATACDTCEKSDGVCGYAPPRNYFVCVCQNGVNTTLDCYGQTVVGFQKGAAPTSLVLVFFNASTLSCFFPSNDDDDDSVHGLILAVETMGSLLLWKGA